MARRIAATVVAFLAALVLVGAAEAAEVRVVRSALESHFPNGMVFTLDATSSRPIQHATISYRVAGKRTIVSDDAELAQGGGTIRAQGSFDLSRDYLPPGTQLQFYWDLFDDQGVRERTQTYEETLEDKRFSWRQIRGQNVQLDW